MKKILITGADSYIGTSFEKYLNNFNGYKVDTIDMIDGSWEDADFSGYDTVFHVAGIAHNDIGKVSDEIKEKYYKVNTELTIETAKKAKTDGASQFIFMSSAIVYGDSAPVGKEKIITKDTIPVPANFYGDSKLQAEKGILPLCDDRFKVAILRPPMIYGKGSKGNYPLLAKLAGKTPVFPKIKNQRSMLYIDNLLEFIRLIVDNEESGIFFPQNAEYSNTSEVVRMIAKAKGKRIILIPGFTWAIKLLGCFTGIVNKAFGNLCYDKTMSEYDFEYRINGLMDSIIRTEE